MASLLNRLFNWKPTLEEFCDPLAQPSFFDCHLRKFPKGIDNTRYDVSLSPEFTGLVQQFARRSLAHEMLVNDWGEPPPGPDSQETQQIRECYTGMMEVAVDQARKNNRIELIQCLQFAVMKFFLQVVDSEFERLRGQFQRRLGLEQHKSPGHSVEIHDRLVDLARTGPEVRYRLVRQLFREMLKMENLRLSKLRKSVLGRSWAIPKAIMFNPLLQLPSLWADEQLMEHYPLVCTDRDDKDSFDRINRLLVSQFNEYLPNWAWPLEKGVDVDASVSDLPSLALRRSNSDDALKAFAEVELLLARSLRVEEFKHDRRSWLDVPENLDSFIYSVKPAGTLRTEHEAPFTERRWRYPSWPKFQQRFIKRLLAKLNSSGVENDIIACHVAQSIYQEISGKLPVRLICQYLSRRVNRKELQRKIHGLPLSGNRDALQHILDRARSSVKAMPGPRRRRLIYSFLTQFLNFRRDLKLAYLAYRYMDQIRLLSRPQDLVLSRNNGTLIEFMLREELRPEINRIRNHVIIKADVRGSTQITSELRKQNLNPASHFSINFFEPINHLLASYGASKVFVEGDAVILSIYEYEDRPYQWLSVSHACGLARKIIEVVDAQNIINRKNGLPELEIGLGIAFSDESPTFLFDEEREIMISSAINRADQLSSCSAAIRRTAYGKKIGRGVAVFSASQATAADKHSNDRLIRYNVNGVELDAPAFYKLKSELALKMLNFEVAGEGSRALVGRYPDHEGKMHWLVIAERPVLQWNGAQGGKNPESSRRFYQVVTDRQMIVRAVEMVVNASRGGKTPSTKSGANPDDSKGPRYLH